MKEEERQVEKKIEPKELVQEPIDTEAIEKLLEPKTTTIDLPKNRLTNMFGQAFLEKINNDNIRIIKNCQPLSNVEKCYVVDPKKKSNHFNTYYFYTNIDNKVNAIIAFDNKKLTNVSKCKMKMDEWVVFFESFDLFEIRFLNLLRFFKFTSLGEVLRAAADRLQGLAGSGEADQCETEV